MTNREDEREQDYQQGYEQGFQVGASEAVAELENLLPELPEWNYIFKEFIMLLRKKEILKQWKEG